MSSTVVRLPNPTSPAHQALEGSSTAGSKAGKGATTEPTSPTEVDSLFVDPSFERNPIHNLDFSAIEGLRINLSAIERRVAALANGRSLKKEAQAAWLINAVRCMDYTTLSGDDTDERVRRLCRKAVQPLSPDMQERLGLGTQRLTAAAVCVHGSFAALVRKETIGTGVATAVVSTAFPHGLVSPSLRLQEVRESVAAGAEEIDMVINRRHILSGDWESLYQEVRACREACGDAHLKVILGTGDLKTLRNVAKASILSMQAGADFIKTSTGKEAVNATRVVSLVMVRMIRDHFEQYGYRVGFKPAGGISTAKDSLLYQVLMKEELGRDWLRPSLFRIGASSLLADIERQLDHWLMGGYSAGFRHAIG